ncbi:hypothetical protein ACPA9J_29575 [Pseudomonas aeruginosa]
MIGEDREGGVFVSENFYYDSEIYDTKIYAFTDRPLYRPGDWVSLKMVGREFRTPGNPRPPPAPGRAPERDRRQRHGIAKPGPPLRREERRQWPLPTAGERRRRRLQVRFDYRGQTYSGCLPRRRIHQAALRSRPRPGQAGLQDRRAGEGRDRPALSGRQAGGQRAPATEPARPAVVDGGQRTTVSRPVPGGTEQHRTDHRRQGPRRHRIAAGREPSRYMLTIFASDGAPTGSRPARRSSSRRGAARYRLGAPQRFSAAGEKVEFSYASEQPTPLKPSSYQWIRLEDRATDSGPVADGRFALTFERPGTLFRGAARRQGASSLAPPATR